MTTTEVPGNEPAPQTPPVQSSLERLGAVDDNLTLKQLRAAAAFLDSNPGLTPENALVLARANHADLFAEPKAPMAAPPVNHGQVMPSRSTPPVVEPPRSEQELADSAYLDYARQLLNPDLNERERMELGSRFMAARRKSAAFKSKS